MSIDQSDHVPIESFSLTEAGDLFAERALVPRSGLLHRIDEVFMRLQCMGWRTAHGADLTCCTHCALSWLGVGPRRPVALAFYVRDVEPVAPTADRLELIVDTILAPTDPGHGEALTRAESHVRSLLPQVGLSAGPSRICDLGGRFVPVSVAKPAVDVTPPLRWATCGEAV
jgi:hypothetical protein